MEFFATTIHGKKYAPQASKLGDGAAENGRKGVSLFFF